MLIRHRISGFINRAYRTAGAIIVPDFGAHVPRHNNILAVLGCPEGKILIPAHNIVTNAGDVYYAQSAVGEAPTNTFNRLVLASAGTPAKGADYADFTPIGSTEKAHTATYPLTNDGDADNTGAGTDIVTHLFTYAKGDFNAASITHGLITNAGPVASPPEPILTGFAFAAAFEKTANDTLKVFVNHEFLGV